MTNDEIRRNDKIRMTKPAAALLRVFDIRASDFFRHSSFNDLCKSGSWSQCIRKSERRLSMNRPGTDLKLDDFARYQQPHAHALKHVKPQCNENKREHRRLNWWLHAETCPGSNLPGRIQK